MEVCGPPKGSGGGFPTRSGGGGWPEMWPRRRPRPPGPAPPATRRPLARADAPPRLRGVAGRRLRRLSRADPRERGGSTVVPQRQTAPTREYRRPDPLGQVLAENLACASAPPAPRAPTPPSAATRSATGGSTCTARSARLSAPCPAPGDHALDPHAGPVDPKLLRLAACSPVDDLDSRRPARRRLAADYRDNELVLHHVCILASRSKSTANGPGRRLLRPLRPRTSRLASGSRRLG